MKSKIKITIFKILWILFLPLLFSCSNLTEDSSITKSKKGLATIKVDVENSDARTILPAIEITNLVLKGKYEGGTEETLASAETLSEMSSKEIEIQTGIWDFYLTATVSGATYSAEETKNIVSGSENPVTFTLLPSQTTGVLDFSLDFEGNDTDSYINKITLTKNDGTIIESKEENHASQTTITYSKTLDEGTYSLKVDFYADKTDSIGSASSVILNSYETLVRIKAGITSTARITGIKLNEIYSITYKNIEDADSTTNTMILKFFRKSEAITLPVFTNSMLTFCGWYTDSSLKDSSKITTNTIKPEESLTNLTIYAKWTAKATGTIHNALDYDFSFSIDSPFLVLPAQKDYIVTFTPKRIESDNTETSIYYNPSDEELYENSGFTQPCANGEKVIFSAAVYCDSKKVTDCTATASAAKKITVTIPAIIYKDNYKLKIYASYLNLVHEAEFSMLNSDSFTEDTE